MPKLQNLLKRRPPPPDPAEEESRARLEARLATLLSPAAKARNANGPDLVPVGPGHGDATADADGTSTTASEAPPGIVVLPGPVWIGGPDPSATEDATLDDPVAAAAGSEPAVVVDAGPTVDVVADASVADASVTAESEAAESIAPESVAVEPDALDGLGILEVARDLQPNEESAAAVPAPDAPRVVIVRDDWDTPLPDDEAIAEATIEVENEPSELPEAVVAAPVESEPTEATPIASPEMAAPGTEADVSAPASKPPSALLGFIRSGGRRRSSPAAEAAEAAPVVAAEAPSVAAAVPADAAGTPEPATRAPRAARPASRPQPAPAPKRAPAKASSRKATATCPYCAEPLATPPVASGRCPRCRQRIVVRRVGDRSILLTEAALPVFLAERRRAVHAGPWTRSRDRWLALAVEADAAPARVARIQREPISEAAVAAARNLYVSTAEQAARQARRDRQWDHASRLSLELAAALFRAAGSPRPVPADALAAHREGLAAGLRGIAEVARSAELRAGTCCSTCTDDDGRVVKISEELRAPTLPHDACPKGLCRCRWYLADHDRAIVSGLLRRQTRPTRRKAGPAA